MNQIQNITTAPYQTQRLILPNGNPVDITFSYKPQQLGWFIETLTYLDFTLKGMRICVSPDILYQWKNKLPFGIACFAINGREPYLSTDFSDGSASLYLLTQAEVLQYQGELSGQAGA